MYIIYVVRQMAHFTNGAPAHTPSCLRPRIYTQWCTTAATTTVTTSSLVGGVA